MKRFLCLIALFIMCSSVFAAEVPILNDGFNGKTLGRANGITYAPGKDGQAAVFDQASDIIEYASDRFAQKAGRIEFDVMLTKPLTSNRPIWCLFSDVGAAGSHYGAINVHWRNDPCQFEYAIFDGTQHHWLFAKDFDWQPNVWHHIALTYGSQGMSLSVDGKLLDHNDYTGGISDTPKCIGWDDGYNQSPPMLVDSFRTSSISTDYLDASTPMFSPNGDGLMDTCKITFGSADDATGALEILKDGKVVGRLLDEQIAAARTATGVWDGRGVPDGVYTVRLTLKSATTRTLEQKVTVDRRWKWSKPAPAFTDFFPLGTWYFWEDDASYINRYTKDLAQVKAYYEYTMQDLADHGFNLIVPVWTPHDHRQLQLDEAQKYGIKAIVHLDEINTAVATGVLPKGENMFSLADKTVKPLKGHPAVCGYYMIDEPSNAPETAKRIALAKQALETVDPKHPGFSCLLGGYEELLKNVDYQVLMVDIYPLHPTWSGDWSGYIAQLERGQKNAGERPLWVIMQAFGKPNNAWKIPTAEEIRAQVWLALAYNAKGILYFIYQSTTGFQGEWLQGLVDMKLKPMDGRLDEVGRVNRDITKLAPILLKLKPAQFDVPLKHDGILAKPFTDSSGTKYAIIVNEDVKRPITAVWTGQPATDMLAGVQTGSLLTLSPGEGRLLRF